MKFYLSRLYPRQWIVGSSALTDLQQGEKLVRHGVSLITMIMSTGWWLVAGARVYISICIDLPSRKYRRPLCRANVWSTEQFIMIIFWLDIPTVWWQGVLIIVPGAL